ncbi:selenoprotein S-like [Asterias rubens]|uniref:selenoprotein S-like n=1 Tax=Asterias rubens TaxID=7604 RepID=UPI001455734B|nr:selenoprotein S-like [Asterias rubens]
MSEEEVASEGAGVFEDRELPPEGNQEPKSVSDGFNFVSEFFAEYGWYILLAAIVLAYLQNRFGSKINKWQQKRSNESGLAHYDAATVLSRQEAMDKARQRMQDEYNVKAAERAEKEKLREEEKRREKIEDWERHKQGQGYRSKKLNKDIQSPTGGEASGVASKDKSKKPSLRPAYNPMMGGSGSGFRPARSRFSGGGGRGA